MVRHDVCMPAQRVHTRAFSDEARERLGLAVMRAREASGHPYRPSFARATGLSVRSIVKLEGGEPVGAPVYEAAARGLPGWDEDTPRVILEGGPIPEAKPQSKPDPRVSPVVTSHPDDPEFWVALADEVPRPAFDELWKIYKDRRRLLAERNHSNRQERLDQSRSEEDSE